MNSKVKSPMASLELSQNIDAPQDLLWDYLATSGGLACWQADKVEGDLESGNFSLHWPQLGARLDLSVAELQQGKQLLLRAGMNTIELRLDPGKVSLVHRGLENDDDLAGYESSWCAALSLLELAVTKHPRKSRHVHWLFETAPGTASLAHCFFTDPQALGAWLGTTSKALVAGAPYQLSLFGEKPLSGHVLYAKRDVCLHSEELGDGALMFRTLPGPKQTRVLALGISTWHTPLPESYRENLKGALYRLAQLMQGVHGDD